MIVTCLFFWGGAGTGRGLWLKGGARGEETTITKLPCPSDGQRYLAAPQPPNIFLGAQKWSKILKKNFLSNNVIRHIKLITGPVLNTKMYVVTVTNGFFPKGSKVAKIGQNWSAELRNSHFVIRGAGGGGQGCVRRDGTSEAAPEAVGQAVGGGCQSGWRRLLLVTNAGRLWTACGQRRVDSKNSQTTPATTSTTSIRQLLGAPDTQTAHHATSSTAPAHQPLGSANAETTPARAPAAAADRTQRPDATCEGKNG